MTALAARAGPRARVLIAADHDATRQGVRLALTESADCSEASNADAAVEAALRDKPDVCVVDFTPRSRSIVAAADIVSKLPDAAVVIMTDQIDEDEFLEAVRAGASGYVSHQIDPARLPFLVRDVMRGEVAVPRALVTRLIDEMRGRSRRRHFELSDGSRVNLTEREWQVVEALRNGMTTRGIAQRLGISDVTVRRHISAVHQKLGVHRRTELLALLNGGAHSET